MNKMFLLFLVVGVVAISNSSYCQGMSNQELVNKSISFHGPYDNWKTLKGDFFVNLNNFKKVYLTINNEKGTAIWKEILDNKDTLVGGFINDKCILKLNGRPIEQKGMMSDILLDCPSIKGKTNYWIYTFGMPFKLLDDQVNFIDNPKLVTFKNKQYWQIKVNYDLTQSKKYWQFYFEPDSKAFKIARYHNPKLKGDSEYIVYEEIGLINGLKIPTRHTWYLYNNNQFIGFEKLKIHQKN